MSRKQVKRSRSPGDFFLVPLGEARLAVGQVLDGVEHAFYGRQFDATPSLEDVVSVPVIFRVWVMDKAIASGRWPVIGHAPLEASLLKPQEYFMQDAITGEFSIYDPSKPIPAGYDECKHLERAAVWDPTYVEDRLRDYFEGRPNKWVESLRPIRPK